MCTFFHVVPFVFDPQIHDIDHSDDQFVLKQPRIVFHRRSKQSISYRNDRRKIQQIQTTGLGALFKR